MGLQNVSDSLEWKPELGTQILIVDRETLAIVSRGEADPWFQWHFGNSYVDADGCIVLNLVRYPDFKVNQYLKEIAIGQTQTLVQGTLWEVRLDPQTGQTTASQELVGRGCEFPVVPSHQAGQPSRFTYLSIHKPDADTQRDVFGAIARFDHQTHTLTETTGIENCYPSEPIYAPDPLNPDHGWILTVVFDSNTDTSEVWIFESDRLDAPPVCRLALPSIIPLSFHGTWQPRSSLFKANGRRKN